LLNILELKKEELLGKADYKYEWNSIIERLNKILEV